MLPHTMYNSLKVRFFLLFALCSRCHHWHFWHFWKLHYLDFRAENNPHGGNAAFPPRRTWEWGFPGLSHPGNFMLTLLLNCYSHKLQLLHHMGMETKRGQGALRCWRGEWREDPKVGGKGAQPPHTLWGELVDWTALQSPACRISTAHLYPHILPS